MAIRQYRISLLFAKIFIDATMDLLVRNESSVLVHNLLLVINKKVIRGGTMMISQTTDWSVLDLEPLSCFYMRSFYN